MLALEIVRKTAEMGEIKIHLGWQIYVLLQQSLLCLPLSHLLNLVLRNEVKPHASTAHGRPEKLPVESQRLDDKGLGAAIACWKILVHASSPDVFSRYGQASFFTGCKSAMTEETGENEAQEGESFYRLRSGPRKKRAGSCRPCQHQVGEIRSSEMWHFFCVLV